MKKLTIALICSLLVTHNAFAAECAMDYAYYHTAEGGLITNIYQSPDGLPSLFYSADMDVNTDGSPLSYHPLDPLAEKGLALNNMGNAITGIYDRYMGKSRRCKPREGACFQRYIDTFIAARDSKYHWDSPWITTTDIIPWRFDPDLGRSVPCTIETGEYEGYFVSQTAYPYDESKSECEQGRYIDSVTINTVVLPRNTSWASQGTATDGFDLVVVYDGEHVAYAVNGDRGPETSIGEVTVGMALRLAGKELTDLQNYDDVVGLARRSVTYLTFPTRDYRRENKGLLDQAQIDSWGAEIFTEWGGPERLAACIDTLKLTGAQ